MRYFIHLAYDGSAYHGWQVQPNAVSVQGKLNGALSTLLRQDIVTTGAGRTDAGVHAACMVAHFDAEGAVDTRRLADKLCRLLPADIGVYGIRAVRPEAHARFDATSRTYHYHVYGRKNPFMRHYAVRLFFTPDYAKMNAAAAELLKATDFTSFSKVDSDARTNVCRVSRAEWVQVEEDHWRFEITADRFLRNMVRAVVGTLLEVGRGRMSLEDFRQVIARKDRCAAGESVAGNALSLVDITYPQDIYLD
ncbi:MAG: tRNA pseudouridine(38-40) synthase TruA [Bacteroidales bacterium]|nr:tRNA pseudouridine(38-40) synthase TruA [Bacteroidales bacterium]